MAAAFCSLAIVACSRGSQRAAPAATATPRLVNTIVSQDGRITPQRDLSGFIAPFQNVVLSTTLTEPAASVAVVEGDRVRTGEVLAVFDVSDLQANLRALERSSVEADANALRQRYQSSQTIGQGVGSADQATASLTQARVRLRQDELDLARDEALLDRGFLAKQTVDQQRTTVESDRAAVASNTAALASARITVATNGTTTQGLQGASIAAEHAAAEAAKAQADQIRAQISRATITAPVDGVVINRNLNPGEYPNGRTLFTIAESGACYAVLNVAPAQLAGMHRGEPVAITLNGTHGRPFAARIVAVLGETAPGATNFTIKAQIDHPSDDLLSGLPLTADVLLDSVSGTKIPRTAFTDGTQTQIVTIDGGTAHLRRVEVLAEDDVSAIVSGIASQTRLVADGDAGIADGDRVAVQR